MTWKFLSEPGGQRGTSPRRICWSVGGTVLVSCGSIAAASLGSINALTHHTNTNQVTPTYLAGGAVQRDDIPLLDGLSVLRHELPRLVVHVDGVRPCFVACGDDGCTYRSALSHTHTASPDSAK